MKNIQTKLAYVLLVITLILSPVAALAHYGENYYDMWWGSWLWWFWMFIWPVFMWILVYLIIKAINNNDNNTNNKSWKK